MEIDNQVADIIVWIGITFALSTLYFLIGSFGDSVRMGLAIASGILALCFMGTILVMEIIQDYQKKKKREPKSLRDYMLGR